jgi:hypothetical protein
MGRLVGGSWLLVAREVLCRFFIKNASEKRRPFGYFLLAFWIPYRNAEQDATEKRVNWRTLFSLLIYYLPSKKRTKTAQVTGYNTLFGGWAVQPY